jgi:hypothetical protein
MTKNYTVYFFLFLLVAVKADSQVLTLKDAVQTALNNYAAIKAKANYLKASGRHRQNKLLCNIYPM